MVYFLRSFVKHGSLIAWSIPMDPKHGIIKELHCSLFGCVDALHPSQSFFSHVGTISCLPGLNQY